MFSKKALTIQQQIKQLQESKFTERLYNLFKKYPNVDSNALGMKHNWEKEPLWKNK